MTVNKRKTAWLCGILSAVLLLCALLPAAVILLALPSPYEKTFYGELDDKYERLESLKAPKLVVVGGSSVAFGYDSRMLEEKTGYPTVNFGLYADLGTKIMMELAESEIRKGDVILLAPELDEQTLSLFFNGLSTLKAADGNPKMLLSLDKSDREKVWGAVWGFMGEKLSYVRDGAPDPDGVYNAGNFNEWGDIDPAKFERSGNIMAGLYDKNKLITPVKEIYAPAFIDYVNEFTAKAKKKGATVYYTFCPVNRLSVVTDGAPEGTEDPLSYLSDSLVAWLSEELDCEVIGSPEDMTMDEMYFYDSNVHLNDLGVPIHTARVADLLCEKLGKQADTLENVTKSEGYCWKEGDFTFRMLSDGGCALIGVDGISARMRILALPAEAGGVPVTRLSADALRGCASLSSLLIPPDSRLREIEDGAFVGLLDLYGVYCYAATPPVSFPAPDNTTLGISVPAELLDTYRASDAFAAYGNRLNGRATAYDGWQAVIDMEREELENAGVRKTSDELFLFESTDGGMSYTVVGLTEEGKKRGVLVFPAFCIDPETEEEVPVTAVEAFAFADSAATAVVVLPDANLACLANYTFASSQVRDLYLYIPVTNITTTVNRNLLTGAVTGFHLQIGEGRVSEYATDYGWSSFAQPKDDYYRDCTIPASEIVQRLGEGGDTPDPSDNGGKDGGISGWTAVVLVFCAVCAVALVPTVVIAVRRRRGTTAAEAADDRDHTDDL